VCAFITAHGCKACSRWMACPCNASESGLYGDATCAAGAPRPAQGSAGGPACDAGLGLREVDFNLRKGLYHRRPGARVLRTLRLWVVCRLDEVLHSHQNRRSHLHPQWPRSRSAPTLALVLLIFSYQSASRPWRLRRAKGIRFPLTRPRTAPKPSRFRGRKARLRRTRHR